jgi:hypothetical protein
VALTRGAVLATSCRPTRGGVRYSGQPRPKRGAAVAGPRLRQQPHSYTHRPGLQRVDPGPACAFGSGRGQVGFAWRQPAREGRWAGARVFCSFVMHVRLKVLFFRCPSKDPGAVNRAILRVRGEPLSAVGSPRSTLCRIRLDHEVVNLKRLHLKKTLRNKQVREPGIICGTPPGPGRARARRDQAPRATPSLRTAAAGRRSGWDTGPMEVPDPA